MYSPTPYNHVDIERYLQQQMSAREMHEFEKAMMEDPFLADAMEGYSRSNFPKAAKHLAAIENKILGQNTKVKVLPIRQRKRTWWQVAAIIFLLIGAALVTFQLNNTTTENVTKPIAATQEKTILASTDSIGPIDAVQTMPAPFPGKNLLAANKKNSPIIIEPTKTEAASPVIIVADSSLVAVTEVASANEAEMNALQTTGKAEAKMNARSMTAALAPATYEYKGRVLDPAGEPLPFASIKAEGTNMGTVTDAKGNFQLKMPDSTVTLSVQSIGYAVANVKLRSQSSTKNITLQEDNMGLSEVVVTGLSSRKKNKINSIQSSTAEPIGGWNSFNEYLNAELDSLRASSSYNPQPNVNLEFSIDKEGKPTNIVITNPISKPLLEKTSEIIRNGPRWRTTDKKAKVKMKISL